MLREGVSFAFPEEIEVHGAHKVCGSNQRRASHEESFEADHNVTSSLMSSVMGRPEIGRSRRSARNLSGSHSRNPLVRRLGRARLARTSHVGPIARGSRRMPLALKISPGPTNRTHSTIRPTISGVCVELTTIAKSPGLQFIFLLQDLPLPPQTKLQNRSRPRIHQKRESQSK